MISTNIEYLKQCNIVPWVDVDFILNKHLKNKGNYSSELLLLNALAISLKAENEHL